MRFAVIGLGGATSMFHVPALRRLPGAELVGGSDLSPERRAEWERATGAASYASSDELLERRQNSANTPASTHS